MNPAALHHVLTEATAPGKVPGLAAGVTTAAGTVFESYAGATTPGGDDPVTADTLFWIASMTKPITSLAAMQLVEQGKLSLDAPIGNILPQLAHPQILQDGVLRPARTAITLRHLLTHTSGFSYTFASAELTAWLAARDPAAPRVHPAALDLPLLFEPGTGWAYGISTDWVGQAVEAASGEPLDAYFTNHIIGPLGMDSTMFVPAGTQRLAGMHRRQPDGSLYALPPTPPQTPEFFSGGGGLFSTLNDYLKFTRVFLNGGAGLVSPRTITAMSINQIGGLRAGVIPSAEPGVPPSVMFPGMDAKWGLGFIINSERTAFGRSPGGLAWGGAANTGFWIDPAQGFAAVLLMQILPAGDLTAMQAHFAFEREVYAAMR